LAGTALSARPPRQKIVARRTAQRPQGTSWARDRRETPVSGIRSDFTRSLSTRCRSVRVGDTAIDCVGLPSSTRGIDSVLATGSTLAAGSTLTAGSLEFCALCEVGFTSAGAPLPPNGGVRIPCSRAKMSRRPCRLARRELSGLEVLKANCITSLAAGHWSFGPSRATSRHPRPRDAEVSLMMCQVGLSARGFGGCLAHRRLRSSTRRILPLTVFGSSSTNSISRGYL
jgi:hypothetical protein